MNNVKLPAVSHFGHGYVLVGMEPSSQLQEGFVQAQSWARSCCYWVMQEGGSGSFLGRGGQISSGAILFPGGACLAIKLLVAILVEYTVVFVLLQGVPLAVGVLVANLNAVF